MIILFYNEINIFNLYLNQINKLELKYNNFFCINNYFCKKYKMNFLLLSNDKGTIIYEGNIYDINKINRYKEFFIQDKEVVILRLIYWKKKIKYFWLKQF